MQEGGRVEEEKGGRGVSVDWSALRSLPADTWLITLSWRITQVQPRARAQGCPVVSELRRKRLGRTFVGSCTGSAGVTYRVFFRLGFGFGLFSVHRVYSSECSIRSNPQGWSIRVHQTKYRSPCLQ